MTLSPPKLDDRGFQDIVRQALRLRSQYCPQWTDDNLSDPGRTLIELFAWMMETTLFRLNRVPEKNYIAFLNLIGVQLKPPQPAHTELVFKLTIELSDPGQKPVSIPAGTEVAMVRERKEPGPPEPEIVFSTDEGLTLNPPIASYLLTSPESRIARGEFEDQSAYLKQQVHSFPFFQEPPRVGNCVYVGFARPLARHLLKLTFDCAATQGVVQYVPDVTWECWTGRTWEALEIQPERIRLSDSTWTELLLLPDQAQLNISGQEAFWVRGRVTRVPVDSATPSVRHVSVATLGGRAPASHSTLIRDEELGRSTGQPGQVFRVARPPILLASQGTGLADVELRVEGDGERWRPCRDFATSTAHDRHFVCDADPGEIRFGPAIRDPDGTVHQKGMVPPEGTRIWLRRYRTGGGTAGNVVAESLIVLKSDVPYVLEVTNHEPARGGRDAETLEHAMFHGPRQLRTRDRAVTAEDFEDLALHVPGVARARCVRPGTDGTNPRPGTVRLLLLPELEGVRRPTAEELKVAGTSLEGQVRRYLDDRRLLCTQLEIDDVTHVWVTVDLKFRALQRQEAEAVRGEVRSRLYAFLNPLRGGPEGTGWPFGRDLYIADIYALVQTVPGVHSILEAHLRSMDAKGSLTETTWHISVPEDCLIASSDVKPHFPHQVSYE